MLICERSESGNCYEIEIKNGDYIKLVPDGPLCYRILISRITVSYICKTLSELDSYVTAFTKLFSLLMDAIEARGESSSDVMVNLLNGYLAAPAKEFFSYINSRKKTMKKGKTYQEDL